MDAAFVAALVGCALVGGLVGRWWTVIVPLVVVPVLYLGTDAGWWGSGLGDGWQVGMTLAFAFTLITTATATALRRIVRRQ